MQFCQEIGGLVGRFILATLAMFVVSRRLLLWIFQVPGLLLLPLVFYFPGAGRLPDHNVEWLKAGIFLAGLFTVAQFSYWGNYLPLVYPIRLRGTGEGFAANVGGRMLGTGFNFVALSVAYPLIASNMPGLDAAEVHRHRRGRDRAVGVSARHDPDILPPGAAAAHRGGVTPPVEPAAQRSKARAGRSCSPLLGRRFADYYQ